MGRNLEIASLVLVFVFGVIPGFVNFYLPALEPLFKFVPEFVFYIAAAMLFGFILRGWWNRHTSSPEPVLVRGCVSADNVRYRGTGRFIDGELTDVDVDSSPFCPECQTEVVAEQYDRKNSDLPMPRSVSNRYVKYWECPNCGASYKRGDEKSWSVRKIFESHFETIAHSDDDRGLDKLRESVRQESSEDPSPTDIWEKYVELTDADQLATDCWP